MMPPITREIGFRGRTIWAQAKWPKRKYKKTDTERIIKYNLNLWGIELKDMGLWGDDFFVTRLFVLIDFHEWLHLFIYHIGADGEGNASDICEAFICEATDELCAFWN